MLTKTVRATLVCMTVLAPLPSYSDTGNPFVHDPEQEAIRDLQYRLEQLEAKLKDSDQRIADLTSEYPSLDLEQVAKVEARNADGDGEITAQDKVIGMINGKCLVHRSWGDTFTIEVLDIEGACKNTPPTIEATQ